MICYLEITAREQPSSLAPEFRKKWPQFGKIAEEIDPCLYEECGCRCFDIDERRVKNQRRAA